MRKHKRQGTVTKIQKQNIAHHTTPYHPTPQHIVRCSVQLLSRYRANASPVATCANTCFFHEQNNTSADKRHYETRPRHLHTRTLTPISHLHVVHNAIPVNIRVHARPGSGGRQRYRA